MNRISDGHRSVHFENDPLPPLPPPRAVSFGGIPLESIPEEETSAVSPLETRLRDGAHTRSASMVNSDWPLPIASQQQPLIVKQDSIQKFRWSAARNDSITYSVRGRLARLQSLLESPCNVAAAAAKRSTLGSSTSMPSLFSIPSWLAEQSKAELAKARMPSRKELSSMGSCHIRYQLNALRHYTF